MTPPSSGWQVPWDGPVDDSLRLSAAGNRRGSDSQPSSGRSQRPSEDEGRRREAERQRQHAEQQKEQQRRDEERRQRQRQKEREEEQARRDAEMRRKREQEEETRRREQTAALAVRKVIQKVRIATPENFESLSSELEQAKKQHQSGMGSQADKVSDEAAQALKQAKQRVDDIVRKREQEEREREEEERRRKEEADRIDRLMKAAAEDVSTTEEKVQEAVEAGKTVEDATAETIVELADEAEKTIDAARSVVEASLQKLSDQKKEMGGSGAAQRARSDLGGLEARLTSGRRTLDTVSTAVQASRSKAIRKAAALKKGEEEKTRFEKFDQDNDSKLSREEVVAFALEEYSFDLPAVTLDTIMLQLEPVTFDKFHKMQVKVAVAMLEAKERVRRAEENEKKRVLEEQQAKIQKVIDEVADLVVALEKQMSDAERESKLLQNLKVSSDMQESDILTAVSATEDIQKQVADGLAAAAEKIKSVEDECSSIPALKGFDRKDLPRLQSRHKQVANRSEKVTELTKNAGEIAVRKAYLEIEQVRGQFVNACRAFMGEKKMTGEQLFAHVCKEGEAITLEQFAAFLPDLNCTDAENKKAKLFQQITGTESEISKCAFAELIRFFYKCVKATLLTDELSIKSKTIRRLQVGEVLEAVEGPTKEGDAGVERVKCRAVGDGATGWVTVAGNQGTPFLEPGGNIYTCVHETVLSDVMSVQDSKTLRRLEKGELVEVLEFSNKDEVVGVTRVKGKAKRDGVTGWVTLVGNQGTTYLEAC